MAEQQFEISKIYSKDISTEAPNNPDIFTQDWEPEISLSLGNNVRELEDSAYEVAITITVTAKLDESIAYIVEVNQAGIFTVSGFDEQQRGYMLGAMAPNILFPYARETIASLSQKAGFPAMNLQPIDFNSLYQQHMEQQAEQNTQNTEEVSENESETKH